MSINTYHTRRPRRTYHTDLATIPPLQRKVVEYCLLDEQTRKLAGFEETALQRLLEVADYELSRLGKLPLERELWCIVSKYGMDHDGNGVTLDTHIPWETWKTWIEEEPRKNEA